MRITFILPTVNMTGGIKVVAIYAAALVERGHSVTLVSPPPQQLSFRKKIRSLFEKGQWPSPPTTPKSHLDGLGLDHRVLETSRPPVDSDVPDSDVVIATWWETAEWVNALSPSKGAKVYFIQHHEVFFHQPIERCHATYRMPMHKIVIARWLSELMRNKYHDNSVSLVPNSVDPIQFHAPVRGKQKLPTIGFLYSSALFKGLDVTLKAIEIVRANIPTVRFVCFGSQLPVAHLPLPKETDFIHLPPQNEIRNIYAKCDVWVTASRTEGFNLPAMEAMACRTPIASTRAGWPEEAIISGKNGILVDVDDINGLAAGISWILSLSESDWQQLSMSAYETSIRGSWADSTEKFENALIFACQRSLRGEISGKPISSTF